MIETIGFLELNSIAKGIEAADAILKAAEVDLIFAKPSCPGKYHVLFTGEVAAVKAPWWRRPLWRGSCVDQCVIPRVHPQVIKAINLAAPPSERKCRGRDGVFQRHRFHLRGGCGGEGGGCDAAGCPFGHRHRR